METLELVIYIILAIIIGSMVFFAVKTWDYMGAYRAVKDEMMDKDDLTQKGLDNGEDLAGFKEVDKTTIVDTAISLWHDCKFGELNTSTSVYLNGNGVFNESDFFSIVKKQNKCDIIQNTALDCGRRQSGEQVDHVVMEDINLPSIVKIRCNANNHLLYIEHERIANIAPVLSLSTTSTSIIENDTLLFTASAVDFDGDTVSITVSGRPVGASFDGENFSWKPDFNQNGTYLINFTASDGSLTDSGSVFITVLDYIS